MFVCSLHGMTDRVPPTPESVTAGNPTIARWIAQGRLIPQAVPGTVADLLPLPDPDDDGFSLTDAVTAEREGDIQ